MLNKEKHQLIMGQVLKDIYTDVSISSFLGFKGGSCAYFLYNLPRFSVDLDFDLLSGKITKRQVVKAVQQILQKYGEIKDQHIKKQTIFFLLSYGETDHNIKIEISTRQLVTKTRDFYEPKEYLGILLLAAKKGYLFASKLAALTLRKQLVMRDVYDVYYFAKNRWEISEEIVKAFTGKTVKDYLTDCLNKIQMIKENQILQGLGELLNEKDKAWIKEHLKSEVVFMLKNYQSVIS